MRAAILSIGTELTNGRNLDTNGQWLSLRLSEIGVPVAYHQTVSDDLDENLRAFRTAATEVDLTIVTGGLGPTADDLTREVLARTAGVELALHEPSLAQIESMFAKRNRPMPERNRVQAFAPVGAEMIPNPEGTAPGLWMTVGRSTFACLPGVPREMHVMYETWLRPRLLKQFGGSRAMAVRTLRTFGTGESHIEELLGDLIRRGRDPEVGITASEATITLRIVAHGATPAEAAAKTEPDAQFIRERLGDLVYGEGDDQLEDAVGRLLRERGQTVATAESCTGGLVGHLLTQVPGSSAYYLGGFVAYSNAAKEKFVGVPAALLEEHGAVSPEVAAALATGVRERFGAHFGVGVTGVAGPGGGSDAKPVGLVYVAVAGPDGVDVGKSNWLSDRAAVKLRSAKTALNILRLRLLGKRSARPPAL